MRNNFMNLAMTSIKVLVFALARKDADRLRRELNLKDTFIVATPKIVSDLTCNNLSQADARCHDVYKHLFNTKVHFKRKSVQRGK